MKAKMLDKNEVLTRLDKKTFYKTLVPSLKVNGKAQALGLCPFHNDRYPSLSINLINGLFNCFACGAKGDVFTFYQKIRNVGFKTALREIAKWRG